MLVEQVWAGSGWIYSPVDMKPPSPSLIEFSQSTICELRSQFHNRSYIIWAIIHILILFCCCFIHCLFWQNRSDVTQWDNGTIHWNPQWGRFALKYSGGNQNLWYFCLATMRGAGGGCNIFNSAVFLSNPNPGVIITMVSATCAFCCQFFLSWCHWWQNWGCL